MTWVFSLLSSPFISVFGVLPVLVAFWWSVLRMHETHSGLKGLEKERDALKEAVRREVRRRHPVVLDPHWSVTFLPHEEQDQPHCQCPAHKNASRHAAEVLRDTPLPPGMTAAQLAESMERLVSSLQAAGLEVPAGLPGVKAGPCVHPDAVPVYAGGELVAWLCPDETCDLQLPANFRPDPRE